MKTAMKERAVQHVYVPTLNDLRIVIIIPLFFRGCLSESPPRTLRLLYSLAITALRLSRLFRGLRGSLWPLKETHTSKNYEIIQKEQFFLFFQVPD